MKRRRPADDEQNHPGRHGSMERWIPVEPLMKRAEEADLDTTILGTICEEIEKKEGDIVWPSEWEKLGAEDPRMDDTERVMFPDETYMCRSCGSKAYFGATCKRDKYCQICGARMLNAGRRKHETE